MMNKTYYISILLICSCTVSPKGNDTGVEYAPQMYHSIPYEALTQIRKEGIPSGIMEQYYYKSNSIKGELSNNILPVENTIPRQRFTYSNKDDQNYLNFDLHPDSVELASRLLKNPLKVDEVLLQEGKHLYINFCSPCHGAEGKGDGKVGKVYKGVANLTSRAYLNITEGHIYHVITHGRNRMWPHKSLISPEDRWKIASYVVSWSQ